MLEDTADLTQGEEIRNTLELWDMRATERNEEGRHREIASKCDEVSKLHNITFFRDLRLGIFTKQVLVCSRLISIQPETIKIAELSDIQDYVMNRVILLSKIPQFQ